jgi:hypothetical protein
LKKHTNLIKTDWRNFTLGLDKEKSSSELRKVEVNAPPNSQSISENPNKSSVPHVKNNPGGKLLPGLGNLRNNPANINRKFKNSTKNNNAFDWANSKLSKFSRKQQDKLRNFSGYHDMSRINKSPAPSGKLSLKDVKNRRLGVELSRTISKLAEDNIGAYTEGDDFWDCDRLAMRQITKESIFSCKMSREKHNIIIILDSSPSCSEYANFYGKIASQCVQYGDVELYDGTNARLVHIYKPREKSFVTFITAEDIFNDVDKWSLFKNRTIIFFGDCDGFDVVLKNTLHNKIYYFYTGYQDDFEYELRHYVECGEACNTKNLKPLYNINNVDSFMKACKKLK